MNVPKKIKFKQIKKLKICPKKYELHILLTFFKMVPILIRGVMPDL